MRLYSMINETTTKKPRDKKQIETAMEQTSKQLERIVKTTNDDA